MQRALVEKVIMARFKFTAATCGITFGFEQVLAHWFKLQCKLATRHESLVHGFEFT